MTDSRIYTSLEHLRHFKEQAQGISFLPRQPASSVLSGRRASRLRGRGLNFEEMRHYLPGDDIRSIDWKATARTGKAHVRVFTEERDRPALLVVDQRMSMFFGSQLNLKSVTAAEAAAIAAFRVLGAGDRVGGITFNDEQHIEFAPRRSDRTVMALLTAISAMNQSLHAQKPVPEQRLQLNSVLKGVARLASHDHLVMIFSDFDGIDDRTRQQLGALSQHNDVVLMLVHDPLAQRIHSHESTIVGTDLLQAQVDLATPRVRDAVRDTTSQRLTSIYDLQKRVNLSVLPLSAGEDTLTQIRRLTGQFAPQQRYR
ncbi:MoxR protein [Luminiphilus syltensis NOR5-1B]|uniref:MoxR protein n=1 Tax=Luminiphilus syltensis NOR5-1B TaxID=565045 RepID=B8KRD0_9GAMM|nr:DUF58 domain-containing protein [Luminiphilus syltensis]EED35551.1 MoxR protein [Luminiphilus syltensis NOR5-1B]